MSGENTKNNVNEAPEQELSVILRVRREKLVDLRSAGRASGFGREMGAAGAAVLGAVKSWRDSPLRSPAPLRRYSAAVTLEECAAQEVRSLMDRAYGGSAGKLAAAFLRSASLTREERDELRKLLDEMEV